jgi:hypothetical protein
MQANEHLRARRRTEKRFFTSQQRIKEQEGIQERVSSSIVSMSAVPSTVSITAPPLHHRQPLLLGPSMMNHHHHVHNNNITAAPLSSSSRSSSIQLMMGALQDPRRPIFPPPLAKTFTNHSYPHHHRFVVAKEECADCHRLNKSVSDCRTVWKHTTPSWKTSLRAVPMPPLTARFLPPFVACAYM